MPRPLRVAPRLHVTSCSRVMCQQWHCASTWLGNKRHMWLTLSYPSSYQPVDTATSHCIFIYATGTRYIRNHSWHQWQQQRKPSRSIAIAIAHCLRVQQCAEHPSRATVDTNHKQFVSLLPYYSAKTFIVHPSILSQTTSKQRPNDAHATFHSTRQ